MVDYRVRMWNPKTSAVFFTVKERYGALSNMSNEFSLDVCGERVRSSEALYQALKFPHLPDVQRGIVEQKSPMSAKMMAKPHRLKIREDWEDVKVDVMWWVLRVKLRQNAVMFAKALEETKDLDIVEKSTKDAFWGAQNASENGVLMLEGANVLGQLLMKLRADLRNRPREMTVVPAPTFPDALLYGMAIGEIRGR
jgi:ribA/ribD-fused uncharacterized protein